MPSYMTRSTYKRLQVKLDHLLKVEKPTIINEVKTAKEHGDLRENAEYHAARDKQKVIYAEIDNLAQRLEQVEFIENLPISGDVVSLGTIISLQEENGDEAEYTILGPEDADTDKNIISFLAPLAKGLIGKSRGEVADLELPGKTKRFKINKIQPYREI